MVHLLTRELHVHNNLTEPDGGGEIPELLSSDGVELSGLKSGNDGDGGEKEEENDDDDHEENEDEDEDEDKDEDGLPGVNEECSEVVSS